LHSCATKSWLTFIGPALFQKDSPTLKITPLIDWYVHDGALIGEAGVSWLVQADDKTILMDVGLNLQNEHPSPLLRNMQNLNVRLQDVPYVFITHLHMDHTGGLGPQKGRTFMPSQPQIDLSHVIAFGPRRCSMATAKIRLIEKPQTASGGVREAVPHSRAGNTRTMYATEQKLFAPMPIFI
jgi:7,8-dihydropterin-6-yl-methyl-4-(beta-D-ribofuranosyl)aminobenzene 5'-phosphate synthase